jgi:transposase-like protein
MRVAKTIESRRCPICGKTEKQVYAGKNRSGSQKCFCRDCKKYYTADPKTREIPEEKKTLAMKMLLGGMSGRKVGQILGFSKANVYNWLKKND